MSCSWNSNSPTSFPQEAPEKNKNRKKTQGQPGCCQIITGNFLHEFHHDGKKTATAESPHFLTESTKTATKTQCARRPKLENLSNPHGWCDARKSRNLIQHGPKDARTLWYPYRLVNRDSVGGLLLLCLQNLVLKPTIRYDSMTQTDHTK